MPSVDEQSHRRNPFGTSQLPSRRHWSVHGSRDRPSTFSRKGSVSSDAFDNELLTPPVVFYGWGYFWRIPTCLERISQLAATDMPSRSTDATDVPATPWLTSLVRTTKTDCQGICDRIQSVLQPRVAFLWSPVILPSSFIEPEHAEPKTLKFGTRSSSCLAKNGARRSASTPLRVFWVKRAQWAVVAK